MPTLTRHATLPYPPQALYDLVNDTESYPHFVPYCLKGQVMEHAHGEKIAQLSFGCFGVERSLTTRNRLTPFSRISMSLVDGPLDALEGAWTFSEHPDGTTIILELDYTLHEGFSIPGLSTLLSTLTHPFYDAFIQEAHRRYAHC